MSLPQTFGVSHVYGLYDTVSFLTLQSDDLSQKAALDVEVMDETGRVITDRLDDLRLETSLSGVLKTSAAIPSVGVLITYNAISYIIKEVSTAGVNNGFRKVTMKCVKYQEIA
jgi:hypothetical protein